MKIGVEIGMHETTTILENFRFRLTPRPTRYSGKEVIQPQVPLRLPCYDFAPVTWLAFGG